MQRAGRKHLGERRILAESHSNLLPAPFRGRKGGEGVKRKGDWTHLEHGAAGRRPLVTPELLGEMPGRGCRDEVADSLRHGVSGPRHHHLGPLWCLRLHQNVHTVQGREQTVVHLEPS